MAQRKFIIDGGFTTNADSDITGNLIISGNILPTINSDGFVGYDLGSPDFKWRDLFLSQGSLYIDGQKVLQSDAGTIVISADIDQSLLTKTTGSGVLTFQSPNPIAISGTLQMGTNKRITSADGLAVVFGDKIDMDANQIINVGAPTLATHVTTKGYVDQSIANVINGAVGALDTLNELAQALGNDANFASTVTNSLALKAASTYVDSQDSATLAAAKAYSDGLAFGTGSDLSAVESRVSTLEIEMNSAEGRLEVNEGDVTALQSDLSTESAAREGGDADTLASAKTYTDGREVAITSAYTTAITTAVEAKNEINELSDVNITSVTNGQFLRYDLGAQKWINVTANTTMIAEGVKLFFTEARAQAAVAADIASAVAAEASDRSTADANLQSQIDFITTNIDPAAIDSLTEIVAAFQTADGDLLTTVTSNTSAINAEVTRATGADTTLQSNIDTVAGDLATEVTRATGAESDLQDAIDVVSAGLATEASTRSSADTTLQGNIDTLSASLASEASTRASADTTLQGNIDTVASDLATEATARLTADATLQGNIDAEATRATTAEGILTTNLAAEVTRATTAEGVLTANLASELTARATGDTSTLTSAQSYTDTAINNLVNGAASAYDTLKEIHDAMATDAELAAAIAGLTNVATANKWTTARTLSLSGDASGSVSIDGSANATISVTIADDSHNHTIANVDGLQTALDAKADDATTFTAGTGLTGGGTLATDRTFNVGAGYGISVAADSVAVNTTTLDARYVQPADLANFHSSATSITSGQAAANATGTIALTFSELSGAVHYSVYLNRILLRPGEYSISGTTVTMSQALLATDDEIEVTGLKIV
jgi:hypothetical protein